MKYIIKKALFPMFYIAFMDVIAYSITTINKDLNWLRYILLFLNLALYVFIVGSIAFKEGEDALNIRIANDSIRKEMIRTGKPMKIERSKEYKSYKGFLIALVMCAPLILILIAYSIMLAIGSKYIGLATASKVLYYFIFSFYDLANPVLSNGSYYFSLISIPILMLTIGIPYILGGVRRERQQLKIEETHRLIHGDDK